MGSGSVPTHHPPAADSNGQDQTWSWPQRTRRARTYPCCSGAGSQCPPPWSFLSRQWVCCEPSCCSHWTDADKVREAEKALAPPARAWHQVPPPAGGLPGSFPGQGPSPAAGRASQGQHLPVLDRLTSWRSGHSLNKERRQRPLSRGVSWPESGLS